MERLKKKMCSCGHDRDTHEHFRTGTDCGMCGADVCPAYRADAGRMPLAGWLTASTARLARVIRRTPST